MILKPILLINTLICCALLEQYTFADELPPSIFLKGTIRDFSCFHLDFEANVDAKREQTGLFWPSLTRNNFPVFIPPSLRNDTSLGIFLNPFSNDMNYTRYALSNYGQFFHDEYYHDYPGINIAIPITLELKLIDSDLGLYQYSSQDFYPINGLGFAKENLAATIPQQLGDNNYWFTTEFRVRFYYKGGEKFEFSGDDDLWVFVDGKLTQCDLGGLHGRRNCTVDMDTLGLTQFNLYIMSIFRNSFVSLIVCRC
jgi:fibro-slime domain-containing protein